jgi:hypothetical protein
MNKLKAMNAAANRYLSRFSRREFFCAFVVTTVANYGLAYSVAGYQSIYLSIIGGFLFGAMFAKFEPAE